MAKTIRDELKDKFLAAGKVTDKYNQKLYVFKTVDGVEHTQIFDLSGLDLEPATETE